MRSTVRMGTRVAFTVSDPWEFGTAIGVGPHHGRVVKVVPASAARSGALIVRVEEPFVWLDQPFDYARLSPRGGRNALTALGRSSAAATIAPVDPAGDHLQGDEPHPVFVIGGARLADGAPRAGLGGLLDRVRRL